MTRFETWEQEKDRRKLEGKDGGWRLEYDTDIKTPGIPNMKQSHQQKREDINIDDVPIRPEKIGPILRDTGNDRVIRSRHMSTRATRRLRKELEEE